MCIAVDFSKTLGKIKPMNGVNNGPVGSAVTKTGNVEAFAAAHIPLVRVHDSAHYSGYGGEFTVDVHRIFRDFSKDETDPASYSFASTDRYIEQIESTGGHTFYRLGASIEHGVEKSGTYMPPDFAKWARVCEHIIRHYTEGWANGFTYGIEYWEIWNEADNCGAGIPNSCWQGTFDQFIDLYCVAASHLKKCFPHLKIGGPAFTWAVKPPQHAFMTAIRDRRVQMDFYSFHCYTRDPEIMRKCIAEARELVDAYGYKDAELSLNEWNYNCGWQGEDFMRGVRTILSQKGAAYTAACMCVGQASALDTLMYYDARPCAYNGLFEAYTYDLKSGYYAVKFFGDLSVLGTEAFVEGLPEGVYATAATNGQSHGILLTRFIDEAETCGCAEPLTLSLGLDCEKYTARLFRADADKTLTEETVAISPEGGITLSLPMYSVVYIELKEK